MRRATAVLLLLCTTCPLLAQERVAAVVFAGLEKTDPEYLRRFVRTRTGAPYDSLQVGRDVQALRNLRLFLDVTAATTAADDGRRVTFHCREVLTLLPILNFGGIQGNGWIQVGGQDFNWLGRGQTLGGYYRYDQRHSFDLHHRAPLLWGPWGLSAGVSRSATVENAPVLGVPQQVEVDRWAVTASGRYTRSPRLSFELGWGYLNERYAPQGQAVPAPAAYDKLLVKAVVSSDRIDYFFHYLDGPAGELTAEAVKTLDEPRIFWKLLGIGRYFRRLGSWGNLALRLRAGLSRNDDSPFVPFVLDSYLTVRGSGNQVARGTAELTLNAEYRGTLVQREWGAVQWVGFSDWSAWRKPAEDLRDMFAENNTVTFVGAGARVILSRLNFLVVRLDYGRSVTSPGDHGFVLGTGQYF